MEPKGIVGQALMAGPCRKSDGVPFLFLMDRRLNQTDIKFISGLFKRIDTRGFVEISSEELRQQLNYKDARTVRNRRKRLQQFEYLNWTNPRTSQRNLYWFTVGPGSSPGNSMVQDWASNLRPRGNYFKNDDDYVDYLCGLVAGPAVVSPRYIKYYLKPILKDIIVKGKNGNAGPVRVVRPIDDNPVLTQELITYFAVHARRNAGLPKNVPITFSPRSKTYRRFIELKKRLEGLKGNRKFPSWARLCNDYFRALYRMYDERGWSRVPNIAQLLGDVAWADFVGWIGENFPDGGYYRPDWRAGEQPEFSDPRAKDAPMLTRGESGNLDTLVYPDGRVEKLPPEKL